jgi:long-chain acyl-CoA synthetase
MSGGTTALTKQAAPTAPAATTRASTAAASGVALRTLPQTLLAHARTQPGRLAQRVKRKGIWREYGFAHVLEQVRRPGAGRWPRWASPAATPRS